MSEFIINSEQLERMIEAIEHDTSRSINRLIIDGVRLVEIVRCRDCRYHDSSLCNWFECSYCGESPRVEPDGFCAWGGRRES